AVIAVGLKLALREGGEENPIVPNARGGWGPRDLDLPQDAVRGADFHRWPGIDGNAGSIGAAKLRPGRDGARRAENSECAAKEQNRCEALPVSLCQQKDR